MLYADDIVSSGVATSGRTFCRLLGLFSRIKTLHKFDVATFLLAYIGFIYFMQLLGPVCFAEFEWNGIEFKYNSINNRVW